MDSWKSCTSNEPTRKTTWATSSKGKVVNLEPSIQAAFVDFGVGRNGFLAHQRCRAAVFSPGRHGPGQSAAGNDNGRGRDRKRRRPTRRRPRIGDRPRIKPPIQDIFKRGDEVLVQVIKEGIGTKGPTLSTYISIPGRYLVLMPALGRVGVSRKIEDEDARIGCETFCTNWHRPRGWASSFARRDRSNQTRAVTRPGLPVATVESDCPPCQETTRRRWISTKKAT